MADALMAGQASLTTSITVEGLDALLRRLPDDGTRRASARRMLDQIGTFAQGEAMRNAPHRTGNLQRSIHHETAPDGSHATVTATANYAPFVELGTGMFGPEHRRIVPKSGKVMRWPGGTMGPGGSLRLTGSVRAGPAGAGASTIFARSTAGMHPHPFMEPARLALGPFAQVVIEREASKLFKAPGAA